MNCFVLVAKFTFDDVVVGAFENDIDADYAAHQFTDETLTKAIENNPSANSQVLNGDFCGFDIVEVSNSRVVKCRRVKSVAVTSYC